MNFIPNKDQINIVELLKQNYNLSIQAVAGAGKTSTSLYIAKQFKNKKILLLTYNRKLSDETNLKTTLNNIDNLISYTFHSFFAKYYKREVKNDIQLNSLLDLNYKNDYILKYDLIIIDEAQDLNFDIYKILVKIINQNYKNSQLIVMGDKFQSIYAFRDSSPLFLQNASKVFKINDYKWKKINLNRSYRITYQTAKFLNKCYFNSNYKIYSAKSIKNSFEYWVCNAFDLTSLFKKLKKYLVKYNFSDIFILSHSIKSTNVLLSRFATELSNRGFLVYKPSNDEEEITDRQQQNKIVFSTFHQAKGRERKVAIIFNFDNSYFEFAGKNENQLIPTNIHYVGLTRGLEKVIVINHFDKSAFKFLNLTNLNSFLKPTLNIEQVNSWKIKCQTQLVEKPEKDNTRSVSDLISFLNFSKLKNYLDQIEIIKEKLDLEYSFSHISSELSFIKNGLQYYENISIFNGIYFPLYYQFETGKVSGLIKRIKELYQFLIQKNYQGEYKYLLNKKSFIKQIIDELENNKLNLMKVVLLLTTIETKDISKLNQIQKIDWISKKDNKICYKIFNKLLSSKIKFEVKASTNYNDKKYVGFIDCIDYDNKTIWEFKFVNQIEDEHRIQILLYKYLLMKNKDYDVIKDYKYKIFNFKTNQIEEINLSDPLTENLFKKIVKLKESIGLDKLDNDQFIKQCQNILKKIKVS